MPGDRSCKAVHALPSVVPHGMHFSLTYFMMNVVSLPITRMLCDCCSHPMDCLLLPEPAWNAVACSKSLLSTETSGASLLILRNPLLTDPTIFCNDRIEGRMVAFPSIVSTSWLFILIALTALLNSVSRRILCPNSADKTEK